MHFEFGGYFCGIYARVLLGILQGYLTKEFNFGTRVLDLRKIE